MKYILFYDRCHSSYAKLLRNHHCCFKQLLLQLVLTPKPCTIAASSSLKGHWLVKRLCECFCQIFMASCGDISVWTKETVTFAVHRATPLARLKISQNIGRQHLLNLGFACFSPFRVVENGTRWVSGQLARRSKPCGDNSSANADMFSSFFYGCLTPGFHSTSSLAWTHFCQDFLRL